MKQCIQKWWIWVAFSVLLFTFCDRKPTEPGKSTGKISGTVMSGGPAPSGPVKTAYLFEDDNLLAVSDENGQYAVDDLEEGPHTLICSALNFRDTTVQVQVTRETTTDQPFLLSPDGSVGRAYGEVQDGVLFEAVDPEVLTWTAQEMYEGVTGATLQTKWLQVEVPPIYITLGDSILAVSDPFGMFWFRLQAGTYPVTASCEGYESQTRVIHIPADDRTYVSYILDRIQ
ncbi:carboxypeptidase-like regulatory domain-containing protein [bacterium]|nr:carboxypeptidase-like regulatory domain-containing protein [bacterium]